MKYRILKNGNGDIRVKKKVFGLFWVWVKYIHSTMYGSTKYIAEFNSVQHAKIIIRKKNKENKDIKEYALKDKQWNIIEEFAL